MGNQVSPPSHKNRNQYLLGLGLGGMPLVVILVGLGLLVQPSVAPLAAALLYSSLALYVAAIIATIVCLSIQSVRFVGYGLLTAVLASPVIAFIGCTVIISAHL